MKYKLINSVTKIETICDKVTIDGFDYYVSNEKIHFGYVWNTILEQIETMFKEKTFHDDLKGVIATNNPNIDVPKVADEDLGLNYLMSLPNYEYLSYWVQDMIKKAYNKSQETHPFSEEDIIEFAEWLIKRLPPQYDCDTTTNYIPQVMINDEKQLWTKGHGNRTEFYTTKELLQLWKEQKPKIVYYE